MKFLLSHTKDDDFKPVMGAQTRNLCYAYLCYARGWVNPLMKITFMKKDPASYSIE